MGTNVEVITDGNKHQSFIELPSVHEIRSNISEIDNLIEDQYKKILERIDGLTKKISIFDKMNEKLLDELEKCPESYYKKKSQLQRIYMNNIEIVEKLYSTRLEYEKLIKDYIKEKRGNKNDLVRNIKMLDEKESSDAQTMVDLLKEMNELFRIKNDTKESNSPADISYDNKLMQQAMLELEEFNKGN